MPWIKKNLMLVLGGLVGLVLLGGSAFFLFSEAGRDTEVTTQLEAKRAEWDRLNNLNPFPDEKNIKALKEEAARVRKVADDLRGSIKPVEVPAVNDTFALRLLIERTISDLTQEAENAGVDLPSKYAFTFQKLRDIGGQFDSNGIPRLAEQVEQIRALCGVLFRAKIHSLDTLRRPAILKEEGAGSDYLTKRSVTNNWVVRTPYDLTFKAFSSELAAVIRGFAALDQLVVIKTINIDPTSLRSSGGASAPMMTMMPATPTPGMMTPPGGGPGGMDPALAARYGLGAGGRRPGEGGAGPGGMDPALASRYGLGGGGEAAMRARYGASPGGAMAPPPTLSAPAATGVPGAPAGPSTVLDEKPLRVIMQVDFVKPKPAPEAAARRGGARPAAAEDGSAAPAEPAAPAAE